MRRSFLEESGGKKEGGYHQDEEGASGHPKSEWPRHIFPTVVGGKPSAKTTE